MNLYKKGIFALLISIIAASCDDEYEVLQPEQNSNGPGLTEISFSSFKATSGPDKNGLEDGTYYTVKPLAIGASSYVVDFGHGAAVTISENGGTAMYDYPNELAQATYTITVTAKSDKGFDDVTLSEDVTVNHTVTTVTSVPDAPTHRDANVFALFSDGFEHNGALLSWENGDDTAGGTVVAPVEGNNVIQLSRLGNSSASLTMDEVEIANTFIEGAASTHIHFDVHSDFSTGIDVLKVSLVNGSASTSYEVDALALTDGEWTSFDLELASDFSAAVQAINEIKFELGTGGSANDHATIHVDNVYLHKPSSNAILNGDFSDKTKMWKFSTFTGGVTDPFGSSSDGSDLDYDGNDTGGKTAGAKWSSSQSGGSLRSPFSRYAYQELMLEPNSDYVLEYQYAIKDDSGNDPIGGRRVVGLIMNGYYVDGADAVGELHSNNLGYYEGFVAEGKFSSTAGDVGTFVSIPFTTGDSGEVAVMFYAVTPKDAYIDNVKVIAQ